MQFIGQLAARVGVSPSAIRFYESVGLLQADGRSDSSYRLYGPRAEQRLRFITRAKSMGMKLAEIRRMIEGPRGSREVESATLHRLIASKTAEIEAKMAQLQATAVELERLRVALEAQPPPESCHLGDCACWLPSSSMIA